MPYTLTALKAPLALSTTQRGLPAVLFLWVRHMTLYAAAVMSARHQKLLLRHDVTSSTNQRLAPRANWEAAAI